MKHEITIRLDPEHAKRIVEHHFQRCVRKFVVHESNLLQIIKEHFQQRDPLNQRSGGYAIVCPVQRKSEAAAWMQSLLSEVDYVYIKGGNRFVLDNGLFIDVFESTADPKLCQGVSYDLVVVKASRIEKALVESELADVVRCAS